MVKGCAVKGNVLEGCGERRCVVERVCGGGEGVWRGNVVCKQGVWTRSGCVWT